VAIVDMSDASANNDFIAVPLSVVDDSSTTTSLSGSYYDYGQLRLYPDGQVRLYPEPRENSEVAAESEEDSEDEEEVMRKRWQARQIPLFFTFVVKALVTGIHMVRSCGRSATG